MTEKERFYLYGGSFLKNLEAYINTRLGKVIGKIIGPSPFSEAVLREDISNISWLAELDKELENKKSDYFVLDLQRCISILLEKEKTLISPLNIIKPDNPILNEYQLIDPLLLAKKQRHLLFAPFISIIKRHFDSERIILLHTTFPRYYVKNHHIHEVKTKTRPFLNDEVALLQECENYFIEKTHCHYIDVSKFYFAWKEQGKLLTGVIFESGCYEDTVNCIENIINGGTGRTERPSFAISMRRASELRNSFFKRAFKVFLNNDYFMEYLIASAPVDFINRYYEDLLLLNNLDWENMDIALSDMHLLDIAPELYQIMYAFAALIKGEYKKCSVDDYVNIFKMGIVPADLLTDLQKRAEEFGCIKRQITSENAGYYFALLMGYNPEKFVTDNMTIKPVKVDVFGSCFSRHSFTIKEDLAVGSYWFHVPSWEPSNPQISYPENLFPEKMNWVTQLIKMQFDRRVFQEISSSDGNWIVIDLYFFTAPHIFMYDGLVYTDYESKISKLIGAKRVRVYDDLVLGDFDELMDKSKAWCDLIKKRYGDHVILLNAQRSSYWIGDDRQIYAYSNVDEVNAFMQKAFDWFAGELDCYTIDISGRFISDSTAFIKQAPAHKEDDCYQLQHDMISEIIEKKPKEKHYDHIPGSMRVNRILRLIQYNSLYAMEQVFHDTFLDSMVIRLDYRLISQYHNEIAEIYDARYSDFEALMKGYSFDNCRELERELLQLSSNLEPAKNVKLKSRYPDYDIDDEIYWDSSSDYHPIHISKPTNFKCFRESGYNRLTWNSVNNAEKYIIYFRDSIDGKWNVLDTINADTCEYSHKCNQDEIWYSVKPYRMVGSFKQYGKKNVVHFVS